MSSAKRVRNRKQSKLMRCVKCPFQVLAAARDLCVQSLTGGGGGGGGNISYGNAMGCPTPQIPSLPRSFGGGGGNSSSHLTRGKVEVELRRRSKCSVPPPRYNAVGFRKIDEEKVVLLGDSYPKTRMNAISRKS